MKRSIFLYERGDRWIAYDLTKDVSAVGSRDEVLNLLDDTVGELGGDESSDEEVHIEDIDPELARIFERIHDRLNELREKSIFSDNRTGDTEQHGHVDGGGPIDEIFPTDEE